MKKNFLYISSIAISSLLAFSACSEETAGVDNNNNEGKTTIDLSVGMAGAPATRAITTLPAPANLSTLPEGTTLYMVMKSEVDAQTDKWTMTKAVTGAVTDKKSAVAFSDAGTPRYWDDCGARLANVSIYGICTPGGTPNTPTIGGKNTYTFTRTPSTGAWSTEANALTISDWTVQTNQAGLNATTFADQDLCYTNNVTKYEETEDHRLKFNGGTKKFDQGDLVFYHALTKVTVNMTAGKGFEAAGGKKAFVSPATATIHGFKVQGDFDITTGVVAPEGADIADITTFMSNDDKSGTAEVVTRSAIIMPGRTLTASDQILTVSADGSTYNVTAAELVDAMPASKVMQQGTEYVINVTISKTGFKVGAYVKAWDTVNAKQVEPTISIDTSWGTTDGTAKEDAFSLYISKTSNTTGYGTASGGAFAENASVAKVAEAWTMTPQLYWQDHTTGYHFRGVWPETVTEGAGAQVVTSGDNQVINVQNVAYTEGTYPSDLMIGIPSNEPDAGITATEGFVNLTFQYIMSQVQVNLTTTDDASQVNLDGATVEIVNGYTAGEVLLKDRTVNTTGEMGSYSLNATSTANKFLSAVVPQNLTFTTAGATTNLRFKITITNTDSTTDVYYADVEPILETEKSTKVAPNGKWESGKHYVYNLKVSKTKINVSATLTDWITVTGNTGIWF